MTSILQTRIAVTEILDSEYNIYIFHGNLEPAVKTKIQNVFPNCFIVLLLKNMHIG